MKGKTRIFVVEDHDVVRVGISALVRNQPDMEVCGEADSAADAMGRLIDLNPDLAVIDLSLKNSSGLELIKNIRARLPRLHILVFSVYDDVLCVESALNAGAHGYMLKGEKLSQMAVAIRDILTGELYVSGSLASRLLRLARQGTGSESSDPRERLSRRERQVLQLIGEWKATKEIAQLLHLSPKTVEYYRAQIKKKLQLTDSTQLLKVALSHSKADPPPVP